SGMRRFGVGMVVTIVSAGSVLSGQKITSVQELDQAMKVISTSFREADAAIRSSADQDAKVPLSLARQVLASTGPFWIAREKADAVKMVRQAVEQMDTLDALLSPDTVDAAATVAAAQEV